MEEKVQNLIRNGWKKVPVDPDIKGFFKGPKFITPPDYLDTNFINKEVQQEKIVFSSVEPSNINHSLPKLSEAYSKAFIDLTGTSEVYVPQSHSGQHKAPTQRTRTLGQGDLSLIDIQNGSNYHTSQPPAINDPFLLKNYSKSLTLALKSSHIDTTDNIQKHEDFLQNSNSSKLTNVALPLQTGFSNNQTTSTRHVRSVIDRPNTQFSSGAEQACYLGIPANFTPNLASDELIKLNRNEIYTQTRQRVSDHVNINRITASNSLTNHQNNPSYDSRFSSKYSQNLLIDPAIPKLPFNHSNIHSQHFIQNNGQNTVPIQQFFRAQPLTSYPPSTYPNDASSYPYIQYQQQHAANFQLPNATQLYQVPDFPVTFPTNQFHQGFFQRPQKRYQNEGVITEIPNTCLNNSDFTRPQHKNTNSLNISATSQLRHSNFLQPTPELVQAEPSSKKPSNSYQESNTTDPQLVSSVSAIRLPITQHQNHLDSSFSTRNKVELEVSALKSSKKSQNSSLNSTRECLNALNTNTVATQSHQSPTIHQSQPLVHLNGIDSVSKSLTQVKNKKVLNDIAPSTSVKRSFDSLNHKNYYVPYEKFSEALIYPKIDLVSAFKKHKRISYYLVKFSGFDDSYNKWLPEDHLNCKDLIRIFEISLPQNQLRQKCITIDSNGDEVISLPYNIEKFITLLSKDEGPLISVYNDIDDSGPPEGFTCINKSIFHTSVTPTYLEYFGCDCSKGCLTKGNLDNCSCFLTNKRYYGKPYDHRGLLTLPPNNCIIECNDKCKCPKGCVNRVVQRGRQVSLQLFKTEKKGWGVITLEDLPKGKFITEYVGEYLTSDEAEKRGLEYDARSSTYLFDLDFNEGTDDDCTYTIDAFQYGNISHFFNHSCDPNVAVYTVFTQNPEDSIYRLAFFTIRPVKSGEELSFDYNGEIAPPLYGFDPSTKESEMENSQTKRFDYKCFCQSKKCRGSFH